MNENIKVYTTTSRNDVLSAVIGAIACRGMDCLIGYCAIEYGVKPLGKTIVRKAKGAAKKASGVVIAINSKINEELISRETVRPNESEVSPDNE